MKVLDLQCVHQHRFEGWFASEEDFRSQLERGLLQCPMCGAVDIEKRLSAPRLNFGSSREPQAVPAMHAETTPTPTVEGALRAAWVAVAQQIVANTDDVGDGFAEEARRMHYGEAEQRAIRGQASVDEALELIDEGIDVMPLPAMALSKKRLQ